MFSRMWFPVAVVGLATLGTVMSTDPVESSFSVAPVATEIRLEGASPFADTVKYPIAGYKLRRRGDFTAEQLPDSVLRSLGITLTFEDEDDSLPRLTARDTIPVPDSLRETDPFRYKYYVALIDSLIHRIVSDSLQKSYIDLMAEEDTLHARLDSADRHMLDSLYYRDSTIRAREAFLAWYNSLSKEERKKYDFEQKMKRRMAVSDSLRKIKEEKKDYRDSVIENTPRILETFALPDSLLYKRIITWETDQDFHNVNARVPDTTFNKYFYDYAFRRKDVNATWLGVAGSPVLTYNYFLREPYSMPVFYAPLSSWSTTAKGFAMYNSKTPYTELAYWGTLLADQAKESDNIRIFTTQNILPSLNFSILYERWGGGGMLVNETTKNKTLAVGVNHLGKRYLMHAGYVANTVNRKENGGVSDLDMVRDTIVDAREIPISLSDASSRVQQHSVFLDQQYRIPFTFINRLRAARDTTFTFDSTATDITTAFIGHSTEYTTYMRKYVDNISASKAAERAFYHDAFNYDDTASSDSLRLNELDNKVFIRLQPWKAEAPVSKLDAGLGYTVQTWLDSIDPDTGEISRTRGNSFYTYAGANGRLLRNMQWDAKGKYYLGGYHAGDFSLQANASYAFYPFRRARKSPVSVSASFEQTLSDPDYYQQHMHANHFAWNNSFDKISSTKLRGKIDIPYWKMSAGIGYSLLVNGVYYDSLTVRQNSSAVSILSATLRKDFVLGGLVHLDNQLLVQLSSDQQTVPLPRFALNGKYFLQFIVQRNDEGEKVLEMQIGANAFYNSSWYAPGWNPNIGVFYNQRNVKYENGPIVDLFINAQWKRACIFVKWENMNMGWPLDKADYFTAHRYINTQKIVKMGLYWPFYTLPGKSSGGGAEGASASRGDANASSRMGGQSGGANTMRSLSR